MAALLNELISIEDIAQLAYDEGLSIEDNVRIDILQAMRSIDVQACPGSGKTTLIASKLILLAKKWHLSNQGICVLSHTNVAKDEIIERLKKSKTPEAQRLLSYPHFIGTIQEFTNRFLAIPVIHSNGVNEITVDNDEYVESANKLLARRQFIWLKGTLNGLGSEDNKDGFLRETYRLISDDGVSINVSKTPRAWIQPANRERAEQDLNRLKDYLDKRGYFLYRDMYTIAQLACNSNTSLCKSISFRFPYVFLDEMQDTQKFQDDLLNKIFPLDNPEIIVQRFGDPDQAIFHGIGIEKANDSFNEKLAKDMDFIVHKSHRFDSKLASKIRSLSLNGIPLETELKDDTLADRSKVHNTGKDFEHCVIIFNDATRDSVVQTFADIVSEQFHEEYKNSDSFVVKAIGAVGNEINPEEEQLKIGHYWADYHKSKAKNNFKENYLIEAVRYCRLSSLSDWSESYKLLLNSILNLLRLAGESDMNGRSYTCTTLQTFLEAGNKWWQFRKTIHLLLSDTQPLTKEFWDSICKVVTSLFNLQNSPERAKQYLMYLEEPLNTEDHDNNECAEEDVASLISLPENMVMHPDGFRIQLSTIHSVKGETHDATLVLETRFRNYDIHQLLNHIAGLDVTKITQATKIKFTRQLYVAASRARHLLCFAIHAGRIENVQQEALIALGWKVVLLDEVTNE